MAELGLMIEQEQRAILKPRPWNIGQSWDNFFEKNRDVMVLYLMNLIAKHQYQYAIIYFDAHNLNLKDRLKPLYYALLYFTDDKDYAKRPPEIVETVNDIIENIKQIRLRL